MSEQALITSIYKRNEKADWRIGIQYNGHFMSLDLNTQIAVGARMQIFLETAEKSRTRYPIDMTFYHLKDNREIDIREIGGRVAYVDGTTSLLQLIPKARVVETTTITENPLALPNVVFKNEAVMAREVSQQIISDNEGYMILARVKEVEDGDTLYIEKPLHYGSTLERMQFEMQPGPDGITIRYNGVDAPEKRVTATGGNAYKDQKNARFGNLWGVSVMDMYDIADESTAQMKEWLPKGTIVILIADRINEGGRPLQDGYNRYLCDVYATGVTNLAKVKEDIKNGKNFIHCCKSLLVEKSKKFPHVPLGFFEMDDSIRSSSILNPLPWVAELGLKAFDAGGNTVDPVGGAAVDGAPDTAVDESESKVTTPSIFLDPKTANIVNGEEPISNAHDFFSRRDDRFEEFIAGIEDDEDLEHHTKLRIGDTILTCPPINIRVNKQANIQKVKTMRTKSSILVNAGQTMTTLTMDLYFHDMEAINGRPFPFKKDSDEYFVVDGLRPLLAQFAKCPFLPIDNYYINQSLGIYDVALLDIEVSTVPNFPESITATITLVEFNSEAYLNDKFCLAESINYPMMRWYYNESLRDRGYKYRQFQAVEGKLDHSLKFKVADEKYLKQRKEAINYLKNADSPEKRKADIEKNDTVVKRKADYEKVKKVKDQIDKYKSFSMRKFDIIDSQKHYTVETSFKFPEKYKELEDKGERENWLTLARERFVQMFGEISEGKMPEPFTYAPGNIQPEKYDYWLKSEKNLFIPPKGRMFFHKIIDDWSHPQPLKNFFDLSDYNMATGYGLIFLEEMEDMENQAKLGSIAEYNDGLDRYVFVANEGNIAALQEIIENYTKLEDKLKEYEEEYNQYVKIVDNTELSIPMTEFAIPGRFITTNITANFSNEFSIIRTQSTEGPTMQYMGGGDPSIVFNCEMDRVSVEALQELIRLSDRYCKEYQFGIATGFLDVENDLANMFGIKSIMIESCQIDTVEDYPGRINVTIHATAFDKTQRQREELRAIANNTADVSKKDMNGHTVAYASDRMFEARLSQLELYPDLELPTYDQLDAVLKKIDAGIDTYKRRHDAIYVDPDFYFSTNRTFRDEIEYAYNADHQLNMYDATGTAVATSNKSVEKMFNTTDEDWERLKHVQAQEETQPVGWMKDWDSQSEQSNVDSAMNSSSALNTSNAANPEVKAFFEKSGTAPAPYEVFPTWEEWKALWGDEATKERYERLSGKPQPEEHTIYRKMDEWINEFFGDEFAAKNWIKELSVMDFDDIETNEDDIYKHTVLAGGVDFDKIKSSTATASYEKPDNYYAANYEYRYNKVLTKNQKEKVKEWENKDKDDLTNDDGTPKTTPHIKKPSIKGDIKESDIADHKGKPPKERIMAYMKAFLNVASHWKQFSNEKPVTNIDKTRVGIAWVDISAADISLDEVKKLTWDWQYNLKTAIKQLAEHYKKAKKLTDDCYNYSFTCRPLDAMFYYYEKPDGQATTVKYMKKSQLCTSVIAAFNNYTKRPYDTRSGYNKNVYLYTRGEEEKNVLTPSGSASYYREKLLELQYYNKKQIENRGIEISADKWKERIKPTMQEFLESKSVDYLYEKYLAHIKKLAELDKKRYDRFFMPDKMADSNGYEYSGTILAEGRRLYELLTKQEQAIANSIEESARQLVADEDPLIMYQTMFYDLRKYDQRGRMVRAFPTFSMHVIHEGDWFGKYKFWDNFYGYNAIESIDVHRSRKIAADTAIITMTNVYSNLTTRRTDIDYLDREMKFWDNMIFSNPSDELVKKKASEVHKNIYLETGARVHLRMGYGSNARDLPVVFNGTISEMEVGDVIEIVCQGDGVELGNTISADPEEHEGGLFTVEEPRDIICKLMASKGSWFKDVMNHVTENQLAKINPLGIMHFGEPFDQDTQMKPLGTLNWFNSEYGEVAQNIYSTNGAPTFSQWLHPSGERVSIADDFSWSNLWENRYKLHNPGAAKNVKVNLYGQTVWDVIQTICLTSPDYIAAVHPFETRSTLFFGKPYWPCVFNYDSTYHYDEKKKTWARHLEKENRRSYMQMKYYTSYQDIIENNIRASEDGLFTNVLVQYDGKETPIIYADADIRYDKLKTRVIEADLKTMPFDYYTSEVMSTFYGCSVLRDNLKDMYKGNILVVGDPTVKPHDMMYIYDDRNDMNGNALVKAVTHHMSLETGYVTSIEPDLLVANDDMLLIEYAKWYNGFVTKATASLLGASMVKKAGRAALNRWFLDADKLPNKIIATLHDKAMGSYLKSITYNDEDFAKLKSLYKDIELAGPERLGLRKQARQKFQDACKEMYDEMVKIEKKAAKETLGDGAKYLTKRSFAFAARNSYKAVAAGTSALSAATVGKNLVIAGRAITCLNPIGLFINAAIWIGTETLFEHYRRFKENLQSVICMPLTFRGKELTAGINNHAGMVYGDSPGKTDLYFDATFSNTDSSVEDSFGVDLIKIANFFSGQGGQYKNEEKEQSLTDLFK